MNPDQLGKGGFPGLFEVLCQQSETESFVLALQDALRDLG
jgi:hypothetical protein